MVFRMLAFNTVTELCSVALMVDQKVYNHCILAPRLHAENILSMIDHLLSDTGVQLKSLNCIVFDRGPGSFMGIRIGLSIAQGLALGADLPLIAVSSLEVLAQGAWRIFSSKHVITTITARMYELYWSSYSLKTNGIDDNNWIAINNVCLVTTEIAKKIIYKLQGEWVLVGTGWNTDQQLVSYINNVVDTIVMKKIMLPEAQDMLALGIRSYKKNEFLCPNRINPIYLCTNIVKHVNN